MLGGACLPAAIMLQFRAVDFRPWIPAVLVAIGTGILDWRYRRIPNWLTLSGFAGGVVVNTSLPRWPGLKWGLVGSLLWVWLLLPFVLVPSLGAGRWRPARALG